MSQVKQISTARYEDLQDAAQVMEDYRNRIQRALEAVGQALLVFILTFFLKNTKFWMATCLVALSLIMYTSCVGTLPACFWSLLSRIVLLTVGTV